MAAIYQTIPHNGRTVKVQRQCEFERYRVVPYRLTDRCAIRDGACYFTDDRDDAIATANDMARRAAR